MYVLLGNTWTSLIIKKKNQTWDILPQGVYIWQRSAQNVRYVECVTKERLRGEPLKSTTGTTHTGQRQENCL